jgi:hypothetical protein
VGVLCTVIKAQFKIMTSEVQEEEEEEEEEDDDEKTSNNE